MCWRARAARGAEVISDVGRRAALYDSRFTEFTDYVRLTCLSELERGTPAGDNVHGAGGCVHAHRRGRARRQRLAGRRRAHAREDPDRALRRYDPGVCCLLQAVMLRAQGAHSFSD